MIRLLCCWVIGILIALESSINFSLHSLVITLLCAMAILFGLILFPKKSNLVPSLLIGFILVLLSATNCIIHQINKPTPLKTPIEGKMAIQLQQTLQEKNKSMQAIFKIVAAHNDSLLHSGIIAYLPKDFDYSTWQVGQTFEAHLQLREIENQPQSSFDYRAFMASKQIYYQSFLQAKQLLPIASGKVDIKLKLEQWRQSLLNVYRQNLSPESFAFIAALSLGYKDELSHETKNYFRQAGIMHVLAVSGLHVGIVAAVLAFFLCPFYRQKNMKFLAISLLLLGIWTYAILTGLSPSVQRAAFMFSLISIAQFLARSTAIHGTIAFSALILLLINPLLLYDVGFQLSYAAVIAIVSLHRPCMKAMRPKGKVAHKLLSFIVVSISAQLGTIPFTLYYFHQLPTYALLANFFAIPLATILLPLALLAQVLQFIFSNTLGIWKLIDSLSQLFIALSQRVSTLPGALLDDIYISKFIFATLLLITILLMSWGVSGKIKYINLSLLLLFFLLISL
ncbi:MAG: ComEC/Rec2 family competence protein [Mangrovibacterium sp.]